MYLTGILAALLESGAHTSVYDDDRFLLLFVPFLTFLIVQDGHIHLLQNVGPVSALLNKLKLSHVINQEALRMKNCGYHS